MAEPVPAGDPASGKRTARSRLWSRSLTFRAVALSSIWAVVALVVIATVISALFRQVSERGFESVISAHLFNLIGSVGLDEDGKLTGDPNLGDLRFSQPLSGWYWAVEPISEGLGPPVRSLSMIDEVPSPPLEKVPFNSDYQRSYTTDGPDGQRLEVLESELLLGQGSKIARFRVMGNLSEVNAEISRFAGRLYGYLALFGLGMVAINAVAILFGLKPLGRVRSALADIRAGTAQRLDGPFPAEIEPLADETNALIESNRRVVERSRTQVGNLAHSLKTPLAVLMNEGRAIGGTRGRLIANNAAAMQKQLDHYLQRARVAAQKDSLAFRTSATKSIGRLGRVMEKLNPEKDLKISLPEGEVVFAGESEDFEEIAGNLLENAMKWSRRVVSVSLVRKSVAREHPTFELRVEDDGPGIPEEKSRLVLKRGARLDESKPGSGLGLSIVHELADEYGGTLRLERSALGGLRVVVALPSG